MKRSETDFAFDRHLKSIASDYDLLTQLFDRGYLEISAIVLSRVMKRIARLVNDIKESSPGRAAYISSVLKEQMSGFADDFRRVDHLVESIENHAASMNKKELEKLISQTGDYFRHLKKAFSFLSPTGGVIEKVIQSWRRHRWMLARLAAVLIALQAVFFMFNRWNMRKHSLKWEIYSDQELSSLYKTTTAERIDFDWGYDAPLRGFKSDNFSMRWTGYLRLPLSGDYTFYTISDDGVSLSIDKKVCILDWTAHAAKRNSATLYLESGCYPLELDYFEKDSAARMHFLWKLPNQSEAMIVPQEAFLSDEAFCH
jgi:hypothetical protein